MSFISDIPKGTVLIQSLKMAVAFKYDFGIQYLWLILFSPEIKDLKQHGIVVFPNLRRKTRVLIISVKL